MGLRVEGLVRAQRDAPGAVFLLVLEPKHGGLSLGIAVGRGRHRRGDQAVAVLHQHVAQIAR